MKAAECWSDLEATLEEAQRRYERGDMAAEAVEELAVLAGQQAHTVP